ncbi:S8 family serine peptidase [Tellurirhabdus rosea]|uniref:S8 family serine peptidase n=1 Tax=Tellurirhabdus rosea TaxID=2674997 RepID=UPI002255BE74|nr:S8 family serine peptidase [Tellurirhabdus rosea]
MKKGILTLLLGVFLASGLSAQTSPKRYFVLLADKANSPFSVNKPEQFLSRRAIERRQKQNIPVTERDLPVNPAYLSAIRQAGAMVWFPSRWANGVLIQADEATLAKVRALPFVKGLERDRALANARTAYTVSPSAAVTNPSARKLGETEGPLSYGLSATQITQLGVDKMHQQGFRGEGMLVCILDAGFRNANTVPYLQHLFQENRIVGTYDFVQKESSVYEDDSHGLAVLSVMAGYSESQLIGPAYKASYLLLRTEDASGETPVEEANWLFGAEYADSTGADVLNSSLGYTTFEDAALNHTYNDLNGKTSLATRAANWASEAGMLVVVSAGNEGAGRWKYVSVPADSPQVLAIGAVNAAGNRASFSSVGPTADNRIKPDLAAMGLGTVLGSPGGSITTGNGTSFASPLVAALAAGFWQAFPRLTAKQVAESLRRSGSQYGTPDNSLGFGIPDFGRAAAFASDSFSLVVFPNPFTDNDRLTVLWNEVSTTEAMDVTLTNERGQILMRQRYPADRLANLSLTPLSLSPGLYYLTLKSEKNQRTVKILKH